MPIVLLVRLKMSNNSTGNSTMNKSSSSSSTKRVSKKSDVPVAPAVDAPVAPVAPVEKVSKKAKAAIAAPVEAAPAPVEAVPAATAVSTTDAAPAELRTVDQEISTLIASHQKLRDEAVSSIRALQRLQKRVAKEVKEAGRRRRRVRREGENGAPREKRPTIFTTPVTLKDELCTFLGKSKGSQMTPADVTRAFSAYVDSHKLKDPEKGHTIHPDTAMRKVLGVKDDESVTYRNIQTYLYKLYVLPEKKKSSSA
jgi:chromatin remodeling complex protein RSC6